jgi:hypothetical protein
MRPEPSEATVVYERTLQLRRRDEIVPFTVRLENMRPWEKGRTGEVEADLIINGLGSKLDLLDSLPFRLSVRHVDTLGCILASIRLLREQLEPVEKDVRWYEADAFGSFFIPLFIDGDLFGVEFEREIQDLVQGQHLKWFKKRRLRAERMSRGASV